MRKFATLALLSLSSLSSSALEYPDLKNPVAKQLLDTYIADKALIESPDLLTPPNPAPGWPCSVAEIDQYRMGLPMAHPDIQKEITKNTRKLMRQLGIGNQTPNTTYSNVKFVPLKASCAQGKLNGELQLLTEYDSKMEIKTSIPVGPKVVNGVMTTTSHVVQRSYIVVDAGTPLRVGKQFSQTTSLSETVYDDAQMNESHRKMQAQTGLNKPVTTRVAVYNNTDGTRAMFMVMDDKKVSAGLLGVNVTSEPVLMTTLTIPVDEERSRTESYKGARLISTAALKNDKMHGEQVTYMDNFAKKMNKRIDQIPGFAEAKEVTINGVDLIEQHTCFQNGAPAKISPCPTE